MTVEAIFFLQFVSSLLVFGLLAKWLLLPWLNLQSKKQALFWLTIPHAFRYVGMVFLVPGVVQPLPDSFSVAAAYGDLLTSLLALLVLISLRSNWKGSLILLWLFNIVGTVDLLKALSQVEVIPLLGAAWYIPTLLVPLLLLTHFLSFVRLIRPVATSKSVLHAQGRP